MSAKQRAFERFAESERIKSLDYVGDINLSEWAKFGWRKGWFAAMRANRKKARKK